MLFFAHWCRSAVEDAQSVKDKRGCGGTLVMKSLFFNRCFTICGGLVCRQASHSAQRVQKL
jgi:hypothetical protein